MKLQSYLKQSGFTLIELMVVIVIISIIASLVVMNISGIDQRKAMQAREVLILDLKKMNRESADQGRIFALVTQPQNDVSAFTYRFDEYLPNSHRESQIPTLRDNRDFKKWQEAKSDEIRALPDRISFTVESTAHDFKQASNVDLLGGNAPSLIWLGNGEVKPVSIQMYYDQKPIGDLIQVDYLGKINAES